MSNHVHLIAVPEEERSLALGVGEAHRRYTRYVNFREGCRGYLFQGRFHSFPLEGRYLLAAVRYVLRNPVRAGMVRHAWDYRWSSAKWFVGDVSEDLLATSSEALTDVRGHRDFLLTDDDACGAFRKHTRTGRPLGSESFIRDLEQRTGRILHPKKPGPRSGS